MPDTLAPAMSLRDRKKEKLRRTVLEVSMRLFMAQGYERTTLEQVCDEAETSLRTLLRYFPTKEVLALGREYVALDKFREDLDGLDPSVPVIEFWRRGVSVFVGQIETQSYLARLKLFDSVPAIEAKMLALQVAYEDLLAAAFSREAGLDPSTDLYGRLLAGMLISGNRAASRQWVASDGKLNLAKLRTSVVDWAIENFPGRPEAVTKSKAKPVRGR